MRNTGLSAWWWAAILAIAAAPAGQAVEVRLELRGVSLPISGEFVVVGKGVAEPKLVRLREVVELATPLPAIVTCQGEGLWCPEIEVAEEPAILPVYPSIEVTARLAGPGAPATLRSGSVQGVVRDQVGEQPIELRRDLAFEGTEIRFDGPRAPLDLRFAFPGAAPVYRWSLVPPDPASPPVLDLGTLTLEPGASASGWLLSEETEAPVGNATVKAARLGDPGSDEPALRVIETKSNARGFFQLPGLDPGTYRVEVAAEGHAKQVLEAVELPEAAETLLGTILLGPPIVVTLQVDPPLHPSGRPWTLALRPVRARPTEQAVEATADAAGVGQIEVDRDGEYYLQVLGPDKREALHFETRELTRSEWVLVEVLVVALEGTVRLGDEPLAAKVKLHGGAGDSSELESGEDGRIAGWIRRPERPWLMADVSWEEAGRPKSRTVEVIPEIDEDVAEITIELPVGVISGQVVDPEGVPQRGVRVLATPEDGASMYTVVRTQSDGSGRFHLTGLEAGRYLVQAGGNGGPASEVVPVRVDRDVPGGEAHLVLWPTRPVTLSLKVDGRPAAGANVRLVGLGRAPVSLSGTTDAQGKEVYALPEAVDRVVATVFDPSRWLWSGCLKVEGDQIRLDLPGLQPGTLTLETTGRTDLPPLLNGNSVLWTGSGGFVTHGTYTHWSRTRGGEQSLEREGGRTILRIPALAPGSYGIGWSGAPEWELGARACAGAVADAEWTNIAPAGRATLSTDGSKQQERRLRELRERSRR